MDSLYIKYFFIQTKQLTHSKPEKGGLDKLHEIIHLSDDEWKHEKHRRKQISRMRLCDIPMDAVIDSSKEMDVDSSDEEENSTAAAMSRRSHFKTRPVDVAEILVAPVSVSYSVPSYASSNNDQQALNNACQGDAVSSCSTSTAAIVQKDKMAVFWVVMLKTRKCYNFNNHLQLMINDLDKEDKNRLQKMATREYEDVMSLMREVFLFQV
jgi:hypothetical protein